MKLSVLNSNIDRPATAVFGGVTRLSSFGIASTFVATFRFLSRINSALNHGGRSLRLYMRQRTRNRFLRLYARNNRRGGGWNLHNPFHSDCSSQRTIHHNFTHDYFCVYSKIVNKSLCQKYEQIFNHFIVKYIISSVRCLYVCCELGMQEVRRFAHVGRPL